MLCDDTRKYFYGSDEPVLKYQRCTRPVLDKIGDEICQGLESDRFMSVDDIVRDREAIYRQETWVTDYHAKYWSLDYRQHRNYNFCFSPYELQCIGDYSLADADKYNFEWVAPNAGGGNKRTP